MSEEETREGWPASYPVGRKLEDSSRPRDWLGTISDGLEATPGQVKAARKRWTEARAEEFEYVEKRLWRDRASGVEYRQVHGNPMLSYGEGAQADVSCFIVADGRLVFLRLAGVDRVDTHHLGELSGHKATGSEPLGEPSIW